MVLVSPVKVARRVAKREIVCAGTNPIHSASYDISEIFFQNFGSSEHAVSSVRPSRSPPHRRIDRTGSRRAAAAGCHASELSDVLRRSPINHQ